MTPSLASTTPLILRRVESPYLQADHKPVESRVALIGDRGIVIMGQGPSLPGPPGTRFRVIGAGMSRTGTKTLNEALTILLDGPVHDSGIQSLGGPMPQIKAWLEIMDLAPRAQTFSEQKKLDWLISEVLDGYVATMDCPAATLTPEIMRVYPDAIVIATTRDQASWWKSMNYLNSLMGTWYLPLVVLWLYKTQVYGMWRERFHQIMKWRYQQEKIEEDTLRKHEDHLREVVPPEKLFFYEVSQGWEPLCKILNVPIPDRPFPHNNNKTAAAQTFRDHIVAGMLSWLFMLTVFSMVTWLVRSWLVQRIS
ncbi:hypothetical protein F4818DRAFT_427720 [Hypoxylon cercidicola]|nr:hypothetical protein F4818DRAFT_427720 [Hypoxylon cercidicola]